VPAVQVAARTVWAAVVEAGRSRSSPAYLRVVTQSIGDRGQALHRVVREQWCSEELCG
jgi:hypothetical protein